MDTDLLVRHPMVRIQGVEWRTSYAERSLNT